MIVRFEQWGAWVRLESMPAVVALDREAVRALGVDGGTAWSAPDDVACAPGTPSVEAPLEVHLAVTSRCGAGCKGCYLDAQPDGSEPPRETIERELDALRDAGVFTVAFGGGEPTTRDDLGVLARAARERDLVPVVTTSGLGLSASRVAKLREFAQVNVSYDGPGDVYDDVRGFDGASVAESAIERLVQAGIRVGINVVLTRRSFPRLSETIAGARARGAVEAQLLRYKPVGRAASLDYYARRLDPEQRRALGPTLRALAAQQGSGEFRIRIDCALVPFLSADEELARDPARLARHGVFGCEAAGALAAVTVEGKVAPCSFAPPTSLAAVDLGIYAEDAELARWRAWSSAPPAPCSDCSLQPVCKGGCKVVASFVDRAHGPDPECPRVLQWRTRSAAYGQE